VKGKIIYERLTRNTKFSVDENMNEKNWNIEMQ
jgi:hypothetical protein